MRVLIVDDSAPLRRLVSCALRAAGFAVDEATDGIDGLAHFHASEPDVILTDINMPLMDGLTFVERIRETPQGHSKPVLVLSSESCPKKRRRAKRCGVRMWIDKPFNAAAMATTVLQISACSDLSPV